MMTRFLQSKQPTVVASNNKFKSFSAKAYSPNGKKCSMRVSTDVNPLPNRETER